MPARNGHQRTFAVLLVVFVLFATVAALLGKPAGAPASAAAPAGPAARAGETSNGGRADDTPTPTATPSSEGSIEVLAFYDINLNSKPDQGETPLKGAEFKLSKDLSQVAAGVTGDDGRCVFSDLNPGAYEVDETEPPEGYTPSRTNVRVGIEAGVAFVLPFPHRMSTVTPQPTATATASAETHYVWLPLVLR